MAYSDVRRSPACACRSLADQAGCRGELYELYKEILYDIKKFFIIQGNSLSYKEILYCVKHEGVSE